MDSLKFWIAVKGIWIYKGFGSTLIKQTFNELKQAKVFKGKSSNNIVQLDINAWIKHLGCFIDTQKRIPLTQCYAFE